MPEIRWSAKCPVCGHELRGPDQITLEARVGAHLRRQHYYVSRLTKPLLMEKQYRQA